MGQGHETRTVVRMIHGAPSADGFTQSFCGGLRTKMPLLGVLADEQNELQIGHERKHWLAPQFGAFPPRRHISAIGVEAGEAEAHWNDGDPLGIVEDLLSDAEPEAQARARRIGVWTPRSMDTDARRLPRDAETGGGRDLEDGSRLMRQRRLVSGRVAADAAGPDVFRERRELRATSVHARGTIRGSTSDQSGAASSGSGALKSDLGLEALEIAKDRGDRERASSAPHAR